MDTLLIGGGILAASTAAIATEIGIAGYFFRRTIIRNNARFERTIKMAGTNWEQYKPLIGERVEWLLSQESEEVYITSRDNLKLYGLLFPKKNSNKIVICFHGYTSKGINDYASISKFYNEEDFNILLIDERAHGNSEGKYIGFGCLERYDAIGWIQYILNRFGDKCEIILHGTSMGGTTVLMTSALDLPSNVKAIISDCAFTSPWDVFHDVLKSMYHIPPTPILKIASIMTRKYAGFSLDECNGIYEVRKTGIPILFIHGDSDTFVPCRMCNELYNECNSDKDILIIKGAGHAESYYKETKAYENKVLNFLKKYID